MESLSYTQASDIEPLVFQSFWLQDLSLAQQSWWQFIGTNRNQLQKNRLCKLWSSYAAMVIIPFNGDVLEFCGITFLGCWVPENISGIFSSTGAMKNLDALVWSLRELRVPKAWKSIHVILVFKHQKAFFTIMLHQDKFGPKYKFLSSTRFMALHVGSSRENCTYELTLGYMFQILISKSN